VGPSLPGGALFGFWQAAYHRFGQWHARGGAQGLTDALLVRLAGLGVEVRCSSPVARVEAPGGAVQAVVTEDGDRLATSAVVTTVNPRTVLLDLLDPPLGGRDAADIGAVRRGNVVQALVHVATDRLPPYPGSRLGDWNGLQSYLDDIEVLRRAWVESEAGLLPEDLPMYAFTTSALDPTLAPPGQHTVYLACPAAPFQFEGAGSRAGSASSSGRSTPSRSGRRGSGRRW
jgi:phytoene dehydrogenase-like protein